MIPDSLRTRGVFFAYMFGPPRFMTREEASRVHGRVCDALGLDDLTFRYSSTGPGSEPGGKGFSLVLERSEGRGGYKVEIDNQNPHMPVRLLMSYTWPPSLEDSKERMDLTAQAVFAGFGGDWTRVMAESRLRAQVNVRGNNALAWLQDYFLRAGRGWIEKLGKPLRFAGVRFEIEATPPAGEPLSGAKREFALEVLRDDERCIYVELMSQWPQVTGGPGASLDLSSVRAIDQPPSIYVDEAYGFLSDRVQALGRESAPPSSPPPPPSE